MEAEGTTAAQAKSLKCDDCGKLLRSELEAQAHAARTKHTNFSESTEEIRSLTVEEKAAQLARLQDQMKQRRQDRDQDEKKVAIEREKVRRKTGKELTEMKQQMELAKAKKIAEEKKREKLEERLARQRVREQIARDRAERALQGKGTAVLQTQSQSSKPSVTKEYTSCRLQIRLFGGKTLVHTFMASDSLDKVFQHITAIESGPSVPFALMTSFPRRVFTDEEAGRSLEELGLLPSAVLIQTKP